MTQRFLTVILGGTIVLAFVFAVLANLWGIVRLDQVQAEESAKMTQVDEALHRALDLQVQFRLQVQEWKNILLRGESPELYDQYFGQFEQAEKEVFTRMEVLRAMPPAAGVPAERIEALTEGLQALGRDYRAALSAEDPADALGFLAVDLTVRGRDRPLGDLMAALVDDIRGWASTLHATAQDRRDRVSRTMILGASGSALVGTLCGVLFFADRRRRERALMKARIRAEEANRAKDSFLTNMSHEIRTPLNGVIGMASVLHQTRLNLDQDECVETIRESGVILLDLVNDILDFARIAEGKLSIENEPFRLLDRLEECCDVVASRAAMKDLDFCLELEADVPEMICGDASRLRQVVLNLLINAIKFTMAGSIVLRVRRVEATTGEWLEFAIEDTGIGICAEDQRNLFRAFSQLDTTSTRLEGGAGLGLAISRDLARLMGGTIELESDSGRGSTFTLRLPCRPAEATALDGPPRLPPDLRGQTIALLDDSARNRPALQRYLEQCGAQVVVFATAHAFRLALVEKVHWSAVVLGALPDVTDPAEYSHTLQDDFGPQLGKFLLWTVRGSMERLEGRDEFDGVLFKPLRYGELDGILAAPDALATPTPETADAAPVPPPELPENPALLVVDDNAINLKVAVRVLRSMGFNDIDQASSGEEALKQVRGRDYDIIFMDMQMPEMDGLDATRAIRAQFDSPERPWIVALTANAMEHHRETCHRAGMNDYLSKPVNRISFERVFEYFSKGRVGNLPEKLSESLTS